jgi:hypothetical protein
MSVPPRPNGARWPISFALACDQAAGKFAVTRGRPFAIVTIVLTLEKDLTRYSTLAGEIGFTDAEGATAPETLRHKNRKGL